MLNQAGGDRQILAKQLGISTHQLSYVTHSGEGEGLLFYGSTILPFVDHFPKNTVPTDSNVFCNPVTPALPKQSTPAVAAARTFFHNRIFSFLHSFFMQIVCTFIVAHIL